MAFFRVLFAGLFLMPMVRRDDLTIKPAMLWMALCFAAMNGMFISAMGGGKAANAILLQYTAPLWMYLASFWLPREKPDPRGPVALVVGLSGIAAILAGGWGDEKPEILLLGLGGGITFGGMLLFLRALRSVSSSWLTVWNHLCAALLLAPLGLAFGLPSWPQLGVLFLFGAIQMGFPYFLMTRGLRTVSPQEAATITLLEPLLCSLWAYLVAPETETPGILTFVGGALILGSLAWRYWPRREEEAKEAIRQPDASLQG
jgi:drug/metabolite transporter (DMT)-like permease